jgi:hypothetical protein
LASPGLATRGPPKRTKRARLRSAWTLTLRVPNDMDNALERQSAALGISKSDLAREGLKRYLRVAELRTLRTRLVARAQAEGINTDVLARPHRSSEYAFRQR